MKKTTLAEFITENTDRVSKLSTMMVFDYVNENAIGVWNVQEKGDAVEYILNQFEDCLECPVKAFVFNYSGEFLHGKWDFHEELRLSIEREKID